MSNTKRGRSLLLPAILAIAAMLQLPFLFPQPVQATGEKYSWSSKNEIIASGGNYRDGVSFKGNGPGNSYTAEFFDKRDENCYFAATLKTNKSNLGSGTFNIIIDPATAVTCPNYDAYASSYTKNVSIGNTGRADDASQSINQGVIVEAIVPEGKVHPSDTGDTITITQDGKRIARKTTTDSEGVNGYKATFNNIPPGTGYEACSKELDVCKKFEQATSSLPVAHTVSIMGAGVDPDGSSVVGCSGGALGYVICPLIEGGSKLLLWIAEQIGGFMELRPLSFANRDPVFIAWKNVLGLANVMLVIAFLFIIFSQATSIGLSSYGIKSLLPKVVAAAVLMNLSYFIAAVMIDVSNIFGNGITDLLMTTTAGMSGGDEVTFSSGLERAVGGVDTIVAGGTLALGAIIAVLAIGIGPAVIALLALFVILAARVAIVVLLVMLAPLAFAAWILPNTEKHFRKWLDLFVQMLVLYPAVMALFAGAVVASTVVANAGTSGGDTSEMQLLIALLILAMPLFALPAIIKGSSSTLAKIGEVSRRRMNQGWDSDMRKRTAQRVGGAMANNNWARSNSKFKKAVGRGGRFVGGYNARRDFKRKAHEANAARNQEEALAGVIGAGVNDKTGEIRKGSYAGRAGGDRAVAMARAIYEKREKEETENAMSAIRSAGVFSPADLQTLAAGGSVTGTRGSLNARGSRSLQRAAMQQIIAAQDAEQLNNMFAGKIKLDAAGNKVRGTDGAFVRDAATAAADQEMLYEEVQKQYATAKGAGAHFVKFAPGKGRGAGGVYTQRELEDQAAVALSSLSWQKLASQDGPSVQLAAEGLKRLSRDSDAYRSLYEAAKTATEHPEIMMGAKGGVREALAQIIRDAETPVPPPTGTPDVAGNTPHDGPIPGERSDGNSGTNS